MKKSKVLYDSEPESVDDEQIPEQSIPNITPEPKKTAPKRNPKKFFLISSMSPCIRTEEKGKAYTPLIILKAREENCN